MSATNHIFIMSDALGSGDDELGRVLMSKLIYSLARDDRTPDSVMFMNGGVRLACEGSDALEDLGLLAEKGVTIRSCGTCLDYYGLRDSLKIGIVGTMAFAASCFLGDEEVVVVS